MNPTEINFQCRTGVQITSASCSGIIEMPPEIQKPTKEEKRQWEAESMHHRITSVLSPLLTLAFAPLWLYGYFLALIAFLKNFGQYMTQYSSSMLGVLIAMIIILTLFFSYAIITEGINLVVKHLQKA